MKNYKKINDHYNNLIQKHGFNQHGMGWRKGFLNKRYSIFLKHLKFNDKKILDYGTGVGSFYSFLVKKKILVKKYNALEINSNLFKFLKKKFKKNFYFTSNRKYFLKNKVDISISNGVHNFNSGKKEKYFYNEIKYLYNISKEAVGISFLNENVDYKENYYLIKIYKNN